MRFSALHGAAAGAAVTALAVALVLRPSALAPHATATPSLEMPATPATSLPRAGSNEVAVVYVAGAVARPGVYRLPTTSRAADAVARAGGLTHDADSVAVNLAAHVTDGDEIAVPRVGASLPTSARAQQRATGRSAKRSRGAHHRRPRRGSSDTSPATSGASTDRAPLSRAVDINTADEATLATVPGIGPTLASRIVAFREVNGRFASVDGLADVSGITPSRFDAIAAFLTVGGP